MKIWIDADATPRPVKEIVFRASKRLQLQVILVANSPVHHPRSKLISSVQVRSGFDVADDYIAERCEPSDIVITNDVPLAAQVVERGAVALRPRGALITADNARRQLAMRDFREDLRNSGVMTGGPRPFSQSDRQRFANALDRLLTHR